MNDVFGRLLDGSCAETAQSMSAHADGELRGLRRLRVTRHLALCPKCREVHQALVATIAGLRSLRDEEPPPRPALADVVVRRIREGGT
jgi:anti-sigma factor RsiW